MSALFNVIIPVFLVVGAGYLAARRGMIGPQAVDGLSTFAMKFAIPCLLFKAIWTLDLHQGYDPTLLISFYTGNISSFMLGLFGTRLMFRRDWPDCVAIGFVALFSNLLLLGIPITERAYGPGALTSNFVIISLHPVICYGIGVTTMEIVRASGGSLAAAVPSILKAMFSNMLVVAIALGFAANLTGLVLPVPVVDALDLLARAGLPAALFALGGVLVRYKPEGDARIITWLCALSLVWHPSVTWTMGSLLGLEPAQFRSAVLSAAMPPGVNAFLFSTIYGVGMRVAASTVLIATALSVLSIWFWLSILP